METNGKKCHCGADLAYGSHCATVHRTGAGLGSTAESLMRARYSAYVLHRGDFLLESWHPDTRPAVLDFDTGTQWLGLEIVRTEAGGALDATGMVEFRARFQRGGEYLELHEQSSFVRLDGRWVYVGPKASTGSGN